MSKKACVVGAYGNDCVGCKLSGSDVMITLSTKEENENYIWNDWFLSQKQAEQLHKDLGEILKENKKEKEKSNE